MASSLHAIGEEAEFASLTVVTIGRRPRAFISTALAALWCNAISRLGGEITPGKLKSVQKALRDYYDC